MKTFIIVNSKLQLFRFSSTNSLGIFSPISSIRYKAARTVTHSAFAKFMIAAILVNCWFVMLSVSHGDTARVPIE